VSWYFLAIVGELGVVELASSGGIVLPELRYAIKSIFNDLNYHPAK
jgi:hypothetical protein